MQRLVQALNAGFVSHHRERFELVSAILCSFSAGLCTKAYEHIKTDWYSDAITDTECHTETFPIDQPHKK